MAIDVLELHLASAMQRLATLQRRALAERDESKLLARALRELSTALEEIRGAQEQLVEARHRLEVSDVELARERERYWQLFEDVPQPYIVTDPASVITEANRAAAQLFNVSQRFLVGKTMSVFVCEDRGGFLSDVSRLASEGQPAELTFKLRPRERAPLEVVATVGADRHGLRWVIRSAASTS
jgi:two-component system, OmpR family, sensor histidine kinase VicK